MIVPLIFSVALLLGGEEAVGPKLQELSVTLKKGGNDRGSGNLIVRQVEGKTICFVLTAAHVVQELRTVEDVIASDGTPKKRVYYKEAEVLQEWREDGRRVGENKVFARVIQVDYQHDLALLRIRKTAYASASVKFDRSGAVPLPGREIYHCLLPGTRVSGCFVASFRSFYNGQAIEIITAGGTVLRVTENHPIFTENGIVPARSLQQGDKLFRYVPLRKEPRDGSAVWLHCNRGTTQIYDKPTPVEQVFGTLTRFGSRKSRRVVAHDFHGDGQFLQGDVDAVWTDGALSLNRETVPADHVGYDILKLPDTDSTSGFMASGSPSPAFLTGASSPDCASRFGSVSEADAGFSQKTLHESRTNLCLSSKGNYAKSFMIGFDEPFRTRDELTFMPTISDRNPLEPQPRGYGGFAATDFLGRFMQAESRAIKRDQIVHLRRFKFSGHVFDLQAANRLIIADSLFVSNCGSPGGQEIGAASLTAGIISQIGRTFEDFGEGEFDQVDCAALGGSSGGGIFDRKTGELLGVVTLGLRSGDSFHYMVPVRRISKWADKTGVKWIMDEKEKVPTEAELEKIPLENVKPGMAGHAPAPPKSGAALRRLIPDQPALRRLVPDRLVLQKDEP